MEIDSIKTIISTNLNQTEDVIRKDIENLLKNYKMFFEIFMNRKEKYHGTYWINKGDFN